jgi:uncharacterized protein (UPF0264 family)
VSVRSVAEAQAALDGGAALIDVKEPARGSLGWADKDTVATVVRFVAGRRPVSAALGELLDGASLPAIEGLRFVKWGLAGCAGRDWRGELQEVSRKLRRFEAGCEPVAVAYVDCQRAAAPQPEQVAAFAVERRWPVLLLDTWRKDGTTLFDWLSPPAVAALRERCKAAGVRLALAGSLGLDHVAVVREIQPDWLAVRGSVCRLGKRTETLDSMRIVRLVKALTDLSLTPTSAED